MKAIRCRSIESDCYQALKHLLRGGRISKRLQYGDFSGRRWVYELGAGSRRFISEQAVSRLTREGLITWPAPPHGDGRFAVLNVNAMPKEITTETQSHGEER